MIMITKSSLLIDVIVFIETVEQNNVNTTNNTLKVEGVLCSFFVSKF